MANEHMQEQINELNRKLDRVLEFVEVQHRKREEWDDLVSDVSIVAKDAFNNTVQVLDKAGVEVDPCGIQCLAIKLIGNLSTMGEMLELMESAKDFFKDASPIFRQIGLDTVNKMNELEQKGYIDAFFDIMNNLVQPDNIAALQRISKALAEVKMDDEIDNKSFWQLFKQMRSPEVRKSLSYSLRLVQAINQKN